MSETGGGCDTLYARGNYLVRLQRESGTPVFVSPAVYPPLNSFIEIEQWIQETERQNEASKEPEIEMRTNRNGGHD